MKAPTCKPVSKTLASWRELLAVKPVRNAAAAREDQGPENLRLTVKRQRPALLVPPISWIIRPSPQKSHVLDRLGREVWEMCDGDRTVENIIDQFCGQHRLTFHEGRVAVTAYLKSLLERGLVAMAFPRQNPSSPTA